MPLFLTFEASPLSGFIRINTNDLVQSPNVTFSEMDYNKLELKTIRVESKRDIIEIVFGVTYYTLSLNGVDGSMPVSKVSGVVPTSILDLRDKLISLLQSLNESIKAI